jgi:hypothetical protein
MPRLGRRELLRSGVLCAFPFAAIAFFGVLRVPGVTFEDRPQRRKVLQELRRLVYVFASALSAGKPPLTIQPSESWITL